MNKLLITFILLLFSFNSYSQFSPDTAKHNFIYNIFHVFKKHREKISFKKFNKEVRDTNSKVVKADTISVVKKDSIAIINNSIVDTKVIPKIFLDTNLTNKSPMILYLYNSHDININVSPNGVISANKIMYDDKKSDNENKHKLDSNKIITISTIIVAIIPTLLASFGLLQTQ